MSYAESNDLTCLPTNGSPAFRHDTPDHFFGDDAEQDHHPNNGEPQVRRDVKYVDRVVQHAHHRRADNDSENRTLPGAQAAPSQDGRVEDHFVTGAFKS